MLVTPKKISVPYECMKLVTVLGIEFDILKICAKVFYIIYTVLSLL